MLMESKMNKHNGRIDYIVTLNATMDTFTNRELAYIVRMTPNGVTVEPYYKEKTDEPIAYTTLVCPKCGGTLIDMVLPKNPPICISKCQNCGWKTGDKVDG